VVYLVALQNDRFETLTVQVDSRKKKSEALHACACLLVTVCEDYGSAQNKTSASVSTTLPTVDLIQEEN
jgi:hypothetical protein